MPVYTVRCKKCGELQDYIGKYENAQKIKCDKCGAETSIKIGKTSWYFRREYTGRP